MINALRNSLETHHLGHTVEYHEQLDSTNTRAWQRSQEGCPHGMLVIADNQTAGRGRHGRSWTSAAGKDLLFSIVLRLTLPTERQGLLTLAIANAVHDAIRSLHPALQVSLKWPNDVLLNGKKTAGILVESRMSGSETVFVAGIGVNVNRTVFPSELSETATSLANELGETVDRVSLLAEILLQVEKQLEKLSTAPDLIVSTFVDCLDDRFKTTTLKAQLYNQSVLEGVFEDVAPDGALLLKTSSGIMRLYAADVTFSQTD